VFENKVLRKIFELLKEEVRGGCRQLDDDDDDFHKF
jgi:hypothetical protein